MADKDALQKLVDYENKQLEPFRKAMAFVQLNADMLSLKQENDRLKNSTIEDMEIIDAFGVRISALNAEVASLKEQLAEHKMPATDWRSE